MGFSALSLAPPSSRGEVSPLLLARRRRGSLAGLERGHQLITCRKRDPASQGNTASSKYRAMSSRDLPRVSGRQRAIKTALPRHNAAKSRQIPAFPKPALSVKNVAFPTAARNRFEKVANDMARARTSRLKTSLGMSQAPGPIPSEKNMTYRARDKTATSPLPPTRKFIPRSKSDAARPRFDPMRSGRRPTFGWSKRRPASTMTTTFTKPMAIKYASCSSRVSMPLALRIKIR
mmetsp:Transcript_16845/g.38978  ORF Transcript_16845/g.38978 Transcript_16845/m.38978 type:complete len:233 (+) Transcript_16845:119-817(+)